ncbi:MAG: DUF1854 domain-containing protein [Armatimonadota bacterium]
MDVNEIRLFYQPAGTLRATVGEDRSYPVVRLYQAWPLSRPGQYLSLQDAKGDEFALVPRLEDLAPESRLVAQEEIRRRYLTARVDAVESVRTEFGVTYWTVRTDKGARDFVVQSLSESCVWLSERHVLISDVDGNRFEIGDLTTLDEASKRWLELVF